MEAMVILEKLQKWWKSWKRKRKRAKAKKKPLEFSKLLAIWAVLIATCSVIASYVLPFFIGSPFQM